jgi:hypothetical protein
MLSKMGWKGDGSGLGKDQQGSSVHLRAIRRVESLGIGAENDTFGERGWKDTNAGYHGVLASLNREYGGGGGSSGSGDGDEVEGGKEGEERRRKRKKRERKDERKRVKTEEKTTKKGKRKRGGDDDDDDVGGRDVVRLPQNKVRAGHARKMREAKDIRNKSPEDMAAIFGVKADQYQRKSCWGGLGVGANLPSSTSADDVSNTRGEEGKGVEKSGKKTKRNGSDGVESSRANVTDECDGIDECELNEVRGGQKKKDKKKRERSREVACDDASDAERGKRKRKDKSKK